MNISNIKLIEFSRVEDSMIPARVNLISSHGAVVEAGGITFADALVTLFATAGYGRFPASVLMEILSKKVDVTDPMWNRVMSELALSLDKVA